MARTVGIGIQNFEKLIRNHCFYIDKTNFIKEWWENEDDVTLITRPRRFGKTLTMDMVRRFFSIEYAGQENIFQNLSLWQDKKYHNMLGSYPVIFLSLANVKETNYTNARRKICQLLVELYSQYHFLQNSDKLTPQDRDFFNRISVDMGDVEATLALGQLSKYLFLYYGKKVLFLLDEYDTPMQEAYANGYWKELSAFIRGIFNAAFKTNAYMERAIMTGITRIGKESIFSDLNNPRIISATTDSYTDSFGFTREEVRLMFEEMIEEWFSESVPAYNDFIRAMLCDDVNRMNLYMNEVAFRTFSFFDSGNVPSRSEPERFYHGFVLGLMVDLSEQYVITSNQESGFGRYDVMLEPKNKQDNAFILEFKVFDPDAKEKTLEDTVYSAQKQIETKGYAASLIAKGIAPEQIRKYGFAFEGKRVLIG